MSFANPLHLSGKQLENFNNTQKALQNITNSQQQQDMNQFGGIRLGLQKQVSFNVEQNSKQQQPHEASFLSNNQQKKQESFFGGGAQNSQSGLNNQFLNNGNRNDTFNNQMNFKKKGESINDLVQQSDETLKQLEDQFKSLNLGNNFKMNGNQSNYIDNNTNSNFPKRNIPQTGTGGSNISSLISDVDKIIQQAQQQTKQLTSNDDGAFRLQNNMYSYNENQGRGFPNVNRGLSSSPSKKKQSRKKSKSKRQHKKSKKNRRKNSNSDDDTSSYSGESDSIIQEQEDESHFDDSSYDENYRDDDYDRHSKIQNKKKFSKIPNNKRNNNFKNDFHDAKSLSNVSRARSNQSKNNQQNHNNNNNGLQKSHLKNLPGAGGQNYEPSIYSSASKMKSQQSQASHQNQIGGFRRCPDESDDNINLNRNNKNTDDSFDINEDFNIIGGGGSSKMSSNNKNRNNKQLNVFKKQQNHDYSDDEDNRYNNKNQDDNQDDIYLMNRYQSQKELNVASSNLQRGIQNQRQQQQQMQINADEDNLIFCINCEEYIKADKVDEHSNMCEPVKDDRFMNTNQVIQKINEKLIKIRFLIKNKNSHIINQPIINNQLQAIADIYEQILEIISICIENNTDIQVLQDVENDIRVINNQLSKNNHSSSHYLLYLTQKVIEFVQRKYEFIGRYGNNKYNQISDEFSQQDNNFNFNQNNNQHRQNNNQRDINNFQNNIDAISIASSNFNKQNSNNQYQKVQNNNNNNRKDPLKIFSKIEENLQNLNPSQSQQVQSKMQGLPPRQPITNNQRNNIFSQDSSPLKAVQSIQPYQQQNKDIFQSPATNYSPKIIQQSPGIQHYGQNQQQGSHGRDFNNFNQPQIQQQNQRANYNVVQPFSIAPRVINEQPNQVNSGPVYSKPNEDYNYNQKNKKNIFSEQPQAIQVQGRQITNQSEKSQDNYEYIYKGSQKQIMGNQNMNQMMPVQTVTIKESQITKAPQNNINYNAQNMNNQGFDYQYDSSPYKLQSPYKANFTDDKQQSVLKQKFFLLANNLKQQYPKSNLYLISDLWKEVLDQQIEERDWQRYLINKFQQ